MVFMYNIHSNQHQNDAAAVASRFVIYLLFFDIDIIDTEYAWRFLYPNHPMIFA